MTGSGLSSSEQSRPPSPQTCGLSSQIAVGDVLLPQVDLSLNRGVDRRFLRGDSGHRDAQSGRFNSPPALSQGGIHEESALSRRLFNTIQAKIRCSLGVSLQGKAAGREQEDAMHCCGYRCRN